MKGCSCRSMDRFTHSSARLCSSRCLTLVSHFCRAHRLTGQHQQLEVSGAHRGPSQQRQTQVAQRNSHTGARGQLLVRRRLPHQQKLRRAKPTEQPWSRAQRTRMWRVKRQTAVSPFSAQFSAMHLTNHAMFGMHQNRKPHVTYRTLHMGPSKESDMAGGLVCLLLCIKDGNEIFTVTCFMGVLQGPRKPRKVASRVSTRRGRASRRGARWAQFRAAATPRPAACVRSPTSRPRSSPSAPSGAHAFPALSLQYLSKVAPCMAQLTSGSAHAGITLIKRCGMP